MHLSGKVCVVTGAASGIGEAVARAFVEAGARGVVVADLNAEELPSYHRNVDNDESVFVHHDEGSTRKPATLSHTPQGILHGADEATRAAFQQRRVPGMRRTLCGVSVDTDRPLAVSTAFQRASA